MNFIEFESEEKLRGGFYTNAPIASFLTKWIAGARPKSLLEPSCGDGAFLEAIRAEKISSLKTIIACESNHEEAAKAAARTALPVRLINSDFLRWYLFHAKNECAFDAVIGNPPFIRYQYLPDEQKALAEKIFSQLSLPFTKHTNAWVPFVLASVSLLQPGGRIAMVLPSELFHIPHAQSVRRYLADQCSRILVLDPEEILFGDTLQGTVLLLAEKKHKPSDKGEGVAIIPAKNRQVLHLNPEELFQNSQYTNGVTIEGKWMPVLLSPNERSLLQHLRTLKEVKPFSEIATVDVGIVTGANKFFLVPDSTVEQFTLQRWAHPMFGRSDHVRGLVFSERDHEANRTAGLPTNFLWFQEENLASLPECARRYLDGGLKERLHVRFKCRTREPWYRVPSVSSAPIAMLKRAHHYPRLVLNTAGAYTTDTAYRIVPKKIQPAALVFGFINSLTCLSAELEGRHYGGGVLELVPSEIERLLVPVIKATGAELRALDLKYRDSPNDTDFLQLQDARVLGKIGLSTSEQISLHAAWARLRDRRHRRTPQEMPQEKAMHSCSVN